MQILQQGLSQVEVCFANSQTAQAAHVQHRYDLPAVLKALDLQGSHSVAHPVLVLVGGAGHLSQEDEARLQQTFIEAIAPLAEELGMMVIDGGTDTGIMRLIGQARSTIGATFPLIGVAPVGKVHYPNADPAPGTHPLEPHHTHFILTPGTRWGDEAPWIAEIASLLARSAPSITVLINGGKVSLVDVQESVNQGRPVFVIAGTGRLADEIAAAVDDLEHFDEHFDPEHSDLGHHVPPALCSLLKVGCFALSNLSQPTAHLKTSLKRFLLNPYTRVTPSPLLVPHPSLLSAQ